MNFTSELHIKKEEIGVRYVVDSSTENLVADRMRVLLKVLHDIVLRRPLYYFTVPGLLMAGVENFIGLDYFKYPAALLRG